MQLRLHYSPKFDGKLSPILPDNQLGMDMTPSPPSSSERPETQPNMNPPNYSNDSRKGNQTNHHLHTQVLTRREAHEDLDPLLTPRRCLEEAIHRPDSHIHTHTYYAVQ